MSRWILLAVLAGIMVAGCGKSGETTTDEPSAADLAAEEAMVEAHDDAVSARIKDGKVAVSACGLPEATGGDTLMGKLQVTFEIKADGSVDGVVVDENGTGSDVVAECVTGVVGGWSFPAHPLDEAVQFTYPFQVGP
jgi:hypothetical protein